MARNNRRSKAAIDPGSWHEDTRKRNEQLLEKGVISDTRIAKPITLPFKLAFAYDLKSINHFTSGWQRYNERQKLLAIFERLGFVKVATPDFKQDITVTRVLGKGQRKFDEASSNHASGSGKQLIDVMKHIGFFRDDTPNWLSGTFIQDDSRRDTGPFVEILLERA